ncbi:MAG: WD40/YVTN/BNR-like repeat-containing protein [Chloroflexota bacterium]
MLFILPWTTPIPTPVLAAPPCGHVGALLGFIALDAHTLVGGTDAGSLAYSGDGGRCWKPAVVAGGGPHRLGAFLRDPRRPSVLLAGAGSPGRVGFGATSGLLRSVDGGRHWTALDSMDGLPDAAFVVDDLIATGKAILAAVSCPDEVAGIIAQQAASYQCGAPIYRSMDGGATWQAAGLGAPQPVNGRPAPAFDGAVQALATQGTSIFAAAIPLYSPPGLYRSDNLGSTWHLAGSNRALEDVTALAALPSKPGPTLLAGVGIVGSGAQVLRSTDGVRVWSPSLSADAFGDPIVLELLTTRHGIYSLGLHHLFISTDNGATWRPTAGSGLGDRLNRYLAELPSGALLLAQGGAIETSLDQGAHWRRVE